MPDLSHLATRMVHRAAQAMYGAAYGRATKRKASAAVVAALRELADDLTEADRHHEALGQIDFTDLRALADSIEKGGE